MDEVSRNGAFIGVDAFIFETFDKLTTHENQRRTEGILK